VIADVGLRLGEDVPTTLSTICWLRDQVMDARDGSAWVRLTVHRPDLIETFLRCRAPTAVADLARDAVETLLEERLLLMLGEQVVTLPYRMKRWPVPSLEV
jgi:hypothetical protein